MQLYADIARQCIANRVAYSSRQEFPVAGYGSRSSSISIQAMALDAIVNVKPALAKKVQERTIAANALQILGTLKDTLSQDIQAYLIEQIMMGTMPRGFAQSGILDQGPSQEEMALAQQQAMNDAMALKQNQQAYEQNPSEYEVANTMNTKTPEEIDQIIMGLQNDEEGGEPEDYQKQAADLGGQMPEGLDMMSQEGAMTPGGVEGMTFESGGNYANPNGLL
jgi:hypothetical protein